MLKPESISSSLPDLPKQPSGTPWPIHNWPRGKITGNTSSFEQLANELFTLNEVQGVTYGLLVVQHGELVFERYAAGASPFYLQYSWSMAKSITQALVGILVNKGFLDLYAPAPVPEWAQDDRQHITLDQLLRMSSGLAFREDYVDGEASDVITMLQFEGRHDMGAFAANQPLEHTPGSHWSYSSGTTNIICRILKDVIGGGASGMLRFMNDELFEPIGVRTATPKFDTSGTFIGSSFLLATPQDFARFGLLYLRGGHFNGQQVIPTQWVDYARSPTHQSDEDCYGAHWWMKPDNPDWFYCSGYDGQRILCIPEKDLVLVRVGRTPENEADYVWDRLFKMVECL